MFFLLVAPSLDWSWSCPSRPSFTFTYHCPLCRESLTFQTQDELYQHCKLKHPESSQQQCTVTDTAETEKKRFEERVQNNCGKGGTLWLAYSEEDFKVMMVRKVYDNSIVTFLLQLIILCKTYISLLLLCCCRVMLLP